MSFNSFLKSINQDTLGAIVEPAKDQETRLSDICSKLDIQHDRGDTIVEEQENE
jgi:hypothetical protein